MNNPLSVCLLNDSFPPIIDGVSTAVLNYARVISDMRSDVVVATPSYPGEREEYSFPVIHYPSVKIKNTSGYRLGVPLRAVWEIKKHRVDIIHSHCPAVSMLVAKSLRTAVKAPVILTYHTKFDIDIENAFESPIMRETATRLILSNIEACDEVWAVSRGAGKSLRTIGYMGDFRIMPNGVDFPKGAADPADTAQLRDELGIPPDMPAFLFVGRMMWYKGARLIIDGLARAKAQGTRFKMVFAGTGADMDEIVTYAGAAGIAEDCIFAGSVTDRKRLRVFYSMADLFLFPSTFDTNGIVVREAAACGLGSALIRGSSAADDIDDGVAGILIDEEPDSLARAVMTAAREREAMRELGMRAMNALYMPWSDAVRHAHERYYDVYDAYRAGRKNRAPKRLVPPRRQLSR